MKTAALIFLVCFILAGCVQMRDYTGVRDGFFGLDVKKGFGEGAEEKDYYRVSADTAVIVRETKNQVKTKLGLPDSIGRNLEGYECWVYEKHKLKLFFEGDYLKEWEEF